MMNSPPHPRRTHRKRISALRLSSDTTSTLPEYIPASNWKRPEPEAPSDLPPGYPDSAEEADEDTDSDSGQEVHLPPRPTVSAATPSPSPRRKRRNPALRRRRSGPTSTDPYLDSLLERSVHALEMSNALLQSSISTQTSMSTLLSSDSPADSNLEVSARRLSSRIRSNRDIHDVWAGDLEEISHGVDSLFDDSRRRHSGHSLGSEGSISMSLPTSSLPPEMHRHLHRRRSSTEFRTAANEPHLRLELQARSQLVSPPPRALTQYVVSNGDDSTIVLPSTLGLRSAPSAYPSPTFPVPAPPPSSVRAYNMLSSLMTRRSSSGSSTPSSTFTSPSFLSRRGSSVSTERGGHSCSPASRLRINQSKSPDCERRTLPESLSNDIRSRSRTPKLTMSPRRPMTPTIEESSPSSSSSDGCPAKQTVKCLRKILDEQPPPPKSEPKKAPKFMPMSPAPLAEAGTSTATASISRLFTKAIHSSSARPPSPPRHSALKQSSSNTTPRPSPTPTPSTLSIPDLLGISIGGTASSSSGRSTPKRISFAELPESYAGTRPGSKFADKQKRRKSKRKDKRAEEPQSWWLGWLMGSGAPSEGRMEDRMNRGWGGGRGAYGSGIDDWAV